MPAVTSPEAPTLAPSEDGTAAGTTTAP